MAGVIAARAGGEAWQITLATSCNSLRTSFQHLKGTVLSRTSNCQARAGGGSGDQVRDGAVGDAAHGAWRGAV